MARFVAWPVFFLAIVYFDVRKGVVCYEKVGFGLFDFAEPGWL